MDSDGESAEVVPGRGHVIGEAPVASARGFGGLLAQHGHADAAGRKVDQDVVALGVCGPETVGAPGLEVAASNDLVEQGIGVVEELARGRLAEDRGVLALELPGEEEELPIDHAAQGGQVWLDGADTAERRDGQIVERDQVRVRARLLDG